MKPDFAEWAENEKLEGSLSGWVKQVRLSLIETELRLAYQQGQRDLLKEQTDDLRRTD